MNYLDKLTDGFRFGIGGIGDALLSLSSFYDDVESRSSSLVFWANDKALLTSFLEPFKATKEKPGLNNTIIFQGWQQNPVEEYKKLTSHLNYKGRGHIPDDLNYVVGWTDFPDKYLGTIKKPFDFLKSEFGILTDDKPSIGLCLWGSYTETWKSRTISKLEWPTIINNIAKKYPGHKMALFGSQKDRDLYPVDGLDGEFEDYRGVEFLTVFKAMNSVSHMLSVDTWPKTWTGLQNIPTTIVETRYKISPQQKMGIPVDPSDKIFLNADFWNFSSVSVANLLSGNFELRM